MPITNATPQFISVGGIQVKSLAFSTAAYTTTNAFATVTGSDADALPFDTVGITVQNTGGSNGVSWQVMGANLADLSDAVIVQASRNVAFGAVDNYSAYPIPYRYVFVQAKDQVGGSHSTFVVNGLLKDS